MACLATLAINVGLPGPGGGDGLPWLWLDDGAGGTTADRADLLARGTVAYERALATWPAWACVVAATTAATWLVLRLMPRRRRPTVTGQLEAGLALGAAGAGFVLVLVGCRWLGFYFARLLDPGAPFFHLHVVPYADLALGLALLAASAWILRRSWRSLHAAAPAPAIVLTCMVALLALPLVPFAAAPAPGGGEFHYDELTLESVRTADPHGRLRAPVDLHVARGLLWATLGAAIAASAAGMAASRAPAWAAPLRHASWLPILPAGACAASTALLYRNLARLTPGAQFSGNVVLPLALLAIAALYARWWWSVRARRPSPSVPAGAAEAAFGRVPP